MKKGFVHLIPVLVLAGVLSIGTVGFVGNQRVGQFTKSNVLSSSDEKKAENEEKKGEKKEGKAEKKEEERKSESSLNSSEKKSESKLEIRSETENSSSKKSVKTKVENNELEIEVEEEFEDEDEDEDEDEGSESTRSGRKIRTNFPITVNPLTNEKIVTTPSGVHVVILPEVAIRNMIKAGFPVVLPEESTPSASPSLAPFPSEPPATQEGDLDFGEEGVLLTELDGQPVYEIPAVQDQKFLGVLAVKVKIKGYVSAENGQIVKLKKSAFDKILDLFSF